MAGKGLPLENEQCQAIRRNGRRCRKYKLIGQRTCEFHGGRTGQKLQDRVRIRHLPRFYSKVLSQTLTDFVKECIDVPPDEQVSLYDELALFRHSALPALKLYDLACSKENDQLQLSAGLLMRESLKDVCDLAEKIVRMNAAAKDVVTIHHIEFVIRQIVRCAYDSMDEDDARSFELLIRTKVKLPKQGAEGTTVTPDQDVNDMDSMVPKQ